MTGKETAKNCEVKESQAVPCQAESSRPVVEAVDEIDLFALGQVIWRGRNVLICWFLLFAMVSAGVSLMLPDIFRAEILLAPAQQDEKSNLPGAVGSLSGLASLAGISIGGKSTDEAIAILKSREFLWDFVKRHKLLPKLFPDDWDQTKKSWRDPDPENQPDLWDAYRLLVDDEVIKVGSDKDSDLVRLQINWSDPELAARWANMLVKDLNDYLRQREILSSQKNLKYLQDELQRVVTVEQRQALFSLISQEQQKAMLANTQEEFVFRVLDKASPPDEKARPKRALIVIIASLLGGFFGLLFLFVREGVRQRLELNRSNRAGAR
ncbi:hypothetical protein C2E25_08270 [Geothermobacter hydrogeniphilus]|uniref:LPS O-antigen chain length determinant protein, WzzB/FepE family n=1 Tax=Geothermobacter hydrogeniphilus TaxID=1969733 RepID=A0A2K2HAK3_9BACT|nr:Wzz/FepE/Etk N-terminal domain-containing protein [Geothermobacter hydrogeniphilus]PNU20291.1 hypothetical protein C2E25_08270 [Geothermobacter hydrogeniphilus]